MNYAYLTRLIFFKKSFANVVLISTFVPTNTVGIAQLVRASVCGTEGRRFEPDYLPSFSKASFISVKEAFLYS